MTTLTRAKLTATTRAYFILGASFTAFGFTAIFARAADAPGLVIAAWRTAIATILLGILFLRQPAEQRRVDRVTLQRGLIGGTIFASALGSFHYALDYTTAANASFLDNVAPLWVGLITLFVLRKPLPRLFWPAVGLALAGAALIVFSAGGLSNPNTGDLIVLAQSLVWGLYLVLTGEWRARVNTLTWVVMVMAVSTFWLTGFSLLQGYVLSGYSTPTTLAMIAAGVISQTGGFLGFNYALGYIPAPRVSIAAMLQPVITAVAAAILLGEAFGGWRLVGGALILSGVYLVTVRGPALSKANYSSRT